MKKITSLYVTIVLLGFWSCSYEYEMPDYSNAVTSFNKEQLLNDIGKIFKEEYAKYNISVSGEGVCESYANEKDVNGNSLYNDTIRGKMNINTKSLEMTYAVQISGGSKSGRKRDVIGTLKRTFKTEVSPFEVQVNMTNEEIIYLPIFYNVKNAMSIAIIEKAQEYGYELSEWKMYISEKDNKGNVLEYFEHEGMIGAPENVNSIDVEIEIYGRMKANNVDYHEKKKIGTFVFRGIMLSDIKFKTLELTTDMQYEYIEEPGLIVLYNIDRSTLPIIDKAHELSYELADCKMYITEKDSGGNVLTRFEHNSRDGMIGAQDGAKTIDVEVEIIGWPVEDGRVNYKVKQRIGAYLFKNIKLSDINKHTLYLTLDMEYEFIK